MTDETPSTPHSRTVAASKSVMLATVVIVFIAAVMAFFVLTSRRVDACASEVLTNGRGVSVNLTTKIVSFDGDSKDIPIEKIDKDGALMVDSLSRLCRQRESKLISNEEYQNNLDTILKALTPSSASRGTVPTFNDGIDLVGYTGNKGFIDFLDKNEDGRVKIIADLAVDVDEDFSKWEENCYYDPETVDPRDYDSVGNRKDGVFNKNLPVPLLPLEKRASANDGLSHLCDEYMIFIRTNKKEIESYGGTGVVRYKVNGTFDITRSLSGSITKFYLTEVQA